MDTEQTNEQDSNEPTDADLIAASLEAGGTESVDIDQEAAAAAARVEEAANPKPAPAKPTEQTAAAEGEPDEPKIAAIIRAREKAYAEIQAAQNTGEQMRQQAEREAEQIRAQARKQAEADYAAELEGRRARFRESPTSALREFGMPTDALVDAVALEGTPQWKAIRAAEERAAAAEKKAGAVDVIKADFDAFKQGIEAEKAQAARAAVEEKFLTLHASVEKAPYLHKRYDQDEILAKAHAKANEWAKAGIQFAHSDIAEYLEHQARQRLAGVPSSPQQVSGGSGAQKVRANGSRTLSAAGGSERRASPRPIHDMAPDEERDELIAASRDARKLLKADT